MDGVPLQPLRPPAKMLYESRRTDPLLPCREVHIHTAPCWGDRLFSLLEKERECKSAADYFPDTAHALMSDAHALAFPEKEEVEYGTAE